MAITLKKLSIALKALLTPEFGAKVEAPALSLNGTLVTAAAAQLNYCNSLSSNAQTQLNAKAALVHVHAGTDITSGTVAGARVQQYGVGNKGVVPDPSTATGSQVLADDGWKKINYLTSAFSTLTFGATTTWNLWTQNYNAKLTLTANSILNVTNMTDGSSGCLKVTQGGAGGWTLTLPANSKLLGTTTLVLTSAPGSEDLLTFVYDGSNFYWSLGSNYRTVI